MYLWLDNNLFWNRHLRQVLRRIEIDTGSPEQSRYGRLKASGVHFEDGALLCRLFQDLSRLYRLKSRTGVKIGGTAAAGGMPRGNRA